MTAPKFCRVCGANLTADEVAARDGVRVDLAGPVTWHGAPVRLPRAELVILHSLVAEAGKPVSFTALMERIGSDAESNVIQTLVSRLRSKLSAAGPKPPITSVWGSGAYTWGVKR